MVRNILRSVFSGWLALVALSAAAITYGTRFPGAGSLTYQFNAASVWVLDLRSGVTIKVDDLPMTGILSQDGQQLLIPDRATRENHEIALRLEDRQTGDQETIGSYADGAFLWAYDDEYLLSISSQRGGDTVEFQRITVANGDVLPLVGYFAPNWGFYAHGRFINFSPDRRFLSLLRFTPEQQPTQAVVFDLLSGTRIWEQEAVLHTEWSADGRWLALQSAEAFALLEVQDTPTLIDEEAGQFIGFTEAAASAVFSREQTLFQLDLSRSSLTRLTSLVHDGAPLTVATGTAVLDPDGRYLLVRRGETPSLLDVHTGELLRPETARERGDVTLHWSRDGLVLWQSNDPPRQILVYDLDARRLVADLSTRNPTDAFRLPAYTGWYLPD